MRKKVIIVGCGFGGLNVAMKLKNAKNIDVLILDRKNHHLFQPLLYQVAMAGLAATEISVPIRSLFRKARNISVLMTDVLTIDRAAKKVITKRGDFSYDTLVLACGAEHSYFGHDEWEQDAPGLKTLEQAVEIRRRVLTAFENAEAESNMEKQRAEMTFIVVGGGATGVELAGAVGEITQYTLRRDFRRINSRSARVILIEAGQRLLTAFDEELAQRAEHDLTSLGVEILKGTPVSKITKDGVYIGENNFIPSRTVIWAAGVKPSHLNSQLGAELDKQGRVHVNENLNLAIDPDIFVIGDQAYFAGRDGKPLPGLAPVALQQGRFVGDKILRPDSKTKFKYTDKGQMATIGRKRAIAQVGNLKFHGFLAWLLWLAIHLVFLIGFRNRFFVIWEWAFGYLSYRKGARIITRREWRSN